MPGGASIHDLAAGHSSQPIKNIPNSIDDPISIVFCLVRIMRFDNGQTALTYVVFIDNSLEFAIFYVVIAYLIVTGWDFLRSLTSLTYPKNSVSGV